MSEKKNSVELQFGYEDKESAGGMHRSVVFSKRPSGADFMRAIEETGGEEPDYILAMMTPAIASFGNLTMPVPMTVLLSLNWRDRELLTAAFFEFLGNTSGDQKANALHITKAHLCFGVTRDGVKYTTVEFGSMMTAYDEIAVRKEANSPTERAAAIVGREIVKLSSADGTNQVDGGLTLEEMKNLDWEDYVNLTKAEEIWRNSFRK